jgi:hypothetical protein
MPTYRPVARFLADYHRLSAEQQAAFWQAVRLFVAGLDAGQFHPRLGVKRFRGIPGAFELRWGPDGRALWMYGEPIPGRPEPHIIWLRVGSHDIYKDL